MVITPDNATLIISESFGRRLSTFDIAANGGLCPSGPPGSSPAPDLRSERDSNTE
jgi:hypothetical protein